jgi:hypothetical protein
MLSAANTTLDLLVLELVLDAALLGAGLLSLRGLSPPVHTGSEDDILADGGGVERGARGVALLEPELGPRPPLRDLRVDVLPHHGRLDPAGDLDLLALVVEAVRNNGLCAIFVRRDLLRGERGGVIELLIVGPVGGAVS